MQTLSEFTSLSAEMAADDGFVCSLTTKFIVTKSAVKTIFLFLMQPTKCHLMYCASTLIVLSEMLIFGQACVNTSNFETLISISHPSSEDIYMLLHSSGKLFSHSVMCFCCGGMLLSLLFVCSVVWYVKLAGIFVNYF